jgi:hypothetical protein
LPEFISKIQRSKKSSNQVLITTHSYDILSNLGISTDEVILLENTPEGTSARIVSDLVEIKAVVEAGLTIADAVIPYTKPKNVEQLSQLNFEF